MIAHRTIELEESIMMSELTAERLIDIERIIQPATMTTEAREGLEELVAALKEANVVLRSVLALHDRDVLDPDDGEVLCCEVCTEEEWPCRTATILTDALESVTS